MCVDRQIDQKNIVVDGVDIFTTKHVADAKVLPGRAAW
jgi:hypothetical protein